MTQAQIAEKMGVSRGTFSDYLTCKAYPRPEKMKRLSEILGVSHIDLTTEGQSFEGPGQLNSELINIAKDLYENPDARSLYTAIRTLEDIEIDALRTIILRLKERKEKAAN